MLTINDDLIVSLLSNKFEIDCFKIKLTQQTEYNPITYSGPGTIYQNENGILRLKMYHAIQDIEKEISLMFQHHKPGKILGDESQFSLEAIDMKGLKWIAENIFVSGDISFPISAHVIKASLRAIKNIEEWDKKKLAKSKIVVIAQSQSPIPFNKKQEMPNGGWKYNKSEFNIDGVMFRISEDGGLLKAEIASEDTSLNDSYKERFMEALSILLGDHIHPFIFSIISENTQFISNNSPII